MTMFHGPIIQAYFGARLPLLLLIRIVCLVVVCDCENGVGNNNRPLKNVRSTNMYRN